MYLKVYTRDPVNEIYSSSLADSIHLAYSYDKNAWQALNHNRGILFAKAAVSTQNQILERGLKNPVLFSTENKVFAVVAERICRDAGDAAKNNEKYICWYTEDFIHFGEEGEAPEKIAEWNQTIELPNEIGEALLHYWENKNLTSDGTGKARLEESFPLISGYGDPMIFYWRGLYYFTGTNDNTQNIGLYVRREKTVQALFSDNCEEFLILGQNYEKDFVQAFWAPEFHIINGKVYLFFAVSGREFAPQAYVMRLKEKGDICNANDWEEPIRVQRPDGSWLSEDGITLDMTYVEAKGSPYLIWSYREGILTQEDTGSMLCIASTNPDFPWKLTEEPRILSRPLYGWENNSSTVNNEGPYAIQRGNQLYLTYSGGAAAGNSYAIGMMSVDLDKNILDTKAWKKRSTPLFASFDKPGIYGPGHNAFFTDEEENLWMIFHAQPAAKDAKRCVGICRFFWNEWGEPFV